MEHAVPHRRAVESARDRRGDDTRGVPIERIGRPELGIALSFFFAGWGPGWSIGLIPGLMGVALLVAWKIESKSQG